MRTSLSLALVAILSCSCVGTTFVIANRSNYDGTRNEASTYGNLTNVVPTHEHDRMATNASESEVLIAPPPFRWLSCRL